MNYQLFIASRYLRSKRRTRFISLITYITAGGVTIGVAALVIVLSVMNGLETEVRDRIIGAEAHVRVTQFHEEPMMDYLTVASRLGNIPHITGVSPFIQSKGMLRFGKGIEGAVIKGIDPASVGQVSDLPRILIAGDLSLEPDTAHIPSQNPSSDSFRRHLDEAVRVPTDSDAQPNSLSGIVIGRQLAFRMGTVIGDSVVVISPVGFTSLLSTPRLKRFRVAGIFETGIFEYDDMFTYVSLPAAQELFDMGSGVTGIEMKLYHREMAEVVSRSIESTLGYPYFPRTWMDMHSTLFRWMKLEKWLYTILLSLIILVAAFNIVSSQIMMVLEKRREIGILKAMGASREGIMQIFLYEGIIVGALGTVLGLILGYLLCWAQQTYKFFSLPGDVYFLSYLPVRMQVLDFVTVALVALGLSLLATVYPARRAAALDPVEVIRYE